VAQDSTEPAITRATALTELRRVLSPQSLPVVLDNFRDKDPLARVGALRALEGIDPKVHAAKSVALLQDPVRGVRITAASLLAGVPSDALTSAQRAALDSAVQEYVATQQINADRAEAHLNLGLLYTRSDRFAKAEEEYRQALTLEPTFAPAYVNLANLYRAQERDKDGERLLREAVTPSRSCSRHGPPRMRNGRFPARARPARLSHVKASASIFSRTNNKPRARAMPMQVTIATAMTCNHADCTWMNLPGRPASSR
jgi:tetratricopeptide (TPR) repeat protein